MLCDIFDARMPAFPEGRQTELRAQLNTARSVTLISGNLTTFRSETAGVSARCYKNGVYGFASMAELSVTAAEAVLKAASDNTAFMDSHLKKGAPPLPGLNKAHVNRAALLRDGEQKVYIEFLRELDGLIAGKYKRLTGRRVAVKADCMEKLLQTSEGSRAHTSLPRCYVYVLMSAETRSSMPVEVFKPFGGFGSFEDNFSDPRLLLEGIDDYYGKLMDKCSGVYPEAGIKTCVLDGGLAGMLAHEAVGHTVEADLVMGGSAAGGRLNSRSPLKRCR
jgi:TldD protein